MIKTRKLEKEIPVVGSVGIDLQETEFQEAVVLE